MEEKKREEGKGKIPLAVFCWKADMCQAIEALADVFFHGELHFLRGQSTGKSSRRSEAGPVLVCPYSWVWPFPRSQLSASLEQGEE